MIALLWSRTSEVLAATGPAGPWLLQGTAVLLLGMVVAMLLRRASASTRHGVWLATLVGLLALPLATLLLPTYSIAVLPASPSPAVESPEGRSSTPQNDLPAAATGTVRTPPAASGAVQRSPGSRSGISLAAALGIAYGAGLLAVLGWLAVGVLRALRLVHRARPVARDHPLRRQFPQLGARQAQPRLLLSSEVDVPLTLGARRPAILLPAAAESWPTAEVRRALVHELAHIERGDWLAHLLAGLACACYWFHPLAWFAGRQLALEAERAADDRVLLGGAEATGYADQLVALARRLRTTPLSTLPMARSSQLPVRVRSILNSQQRRSPMNRVLKFALSSLFVAAILPLAAARLTPAQATASGEIPDLYAAAAEGDVRTARQLIDDGADVDQKVAGRGTPLIVAAAEGDLEMVELLLAEGADVGLTETRGPRRSGLQRSALTTAAGAGHLAIVETLLAAGAEVDMAPRGDATALIEAIRSGHTDIALLLLDSGADPDRKMRNDGSPLIAAARRGDLVLTEALLAQGADPSARVNTDENPIYHAIRGGHEQIVRALIQAGASVEAEWQGDGTALIEAARRGEEGLVEELLDSGADPNQAVNGDGSPLIQAAARGDLVVIELLLDRGADVNQGVIGDGNPLIAAAGSGHVPALEMLIRAGAEVDRVVPGDENALIQAAGHGYLPAVEYLVSEGADVNARVITDDGELRTPLNRAELRGHQQVVNYLRSMGARE
ncbi:MAG: ankyrin repeat domain-containing protein [Acidobacteriota bacterium]